MSDRMLHRVFDHSRATGTAYAILLALADFTNDSEGCARPSLPALARKARVSRATAARAIRQLEALGELRTKSGATKGTISHYTITLKGRDRGDRHPSQSEIPPSHREIPTRLTERSHPSQSETQTDQRTDQDQQIREQRSALRAAALRKVDIAAVWKRHHGTRLNAKQLDELDAVAERFGSERATDFLLLIEEAALGGWRVPLFLRVADDRLAGRTRDTTPLAVRAKSAKPVEPPPARVDPAKPVDRRFPASVQNWQQHALRYGVAEVTRWSGPPPAELEGWSPLRFAESYDARNAAGSVITPAGG